jgi:Membrane protein implicated in regulation of membrane protease activity
VFLVGSLFSLVLLRPIARRHINMPSSRARARMPGRPPCDRDAKGRRTGGRVLIGGEEWSARSYLDDEAYDEGTTVDVVKIEGATALVSQ